MAGPTVILTLPSAQHHQLSPGSPATHVFSSNPPFKSSPAFELANLTLYKMHFCNRHMVLVASNSTHKSSLPHTDMGCWQTWLQFKGVVPSPAVTPHIQGSKAAVVLVSSDPAVSQGRLERVGNPRVTWLSEARPQGPVHWVMCLL